MSYDHSALIVCPEAQVDNQNHLTGVLARCMADATYFNGPPNYTDGLNNYCVRHTTCPSVLLTRVHQPLERPEYDAEEELDLTKASLAQQLLVMYEVSEPPMQPGPTKIIYAVDVEPFQTLAALNLTRIEIEA